MIATCRCGAYKLLTATGVRYEENAGAICRHTVEACKWFAELPTPVADSSRQVSAPRPDEDGVALRCSHGVVGGCSDPCREVVKICGTGRAPKAKEDGNG